MSATEAVAGELTIDVVYALPDDAVMRRFVLPSGSVVGDAVALFLDAVGAQNCPHDGVGIFSRRRELSAPLRDGDRVELYRPLLVDPKQVRRERARLAR